MAKGFILGSGLKSEIYGIIGVEVNSSDTVTCVSGTGEELTPKTGAARHIFEIPKAGAWTVSNGTSTKTLQIRQKGQCAVIQLRVLTLLSGTEGFSEYWGVFASTTQTSTSSYYNQAPTAQQTANGAFVSLEASGFKYGTFGTAAPIDLSNFSRLHFDLKNCEIQGLLNPKDIKINITDSITGNYSTHVVESRVIDPPTGGSFFDQIIDISTINGSYYITFEIKTRAETSSFYVDNVVLD